MARKSPAQPSGLQVSTPHVWSGLDSTGKRVRNRPVVAPSVPAAVAALKREGHHPTEVRARSAGGSLNVNIGPEGVKFKYSHKAEFARRLYQMQRAGISTSAALASMGEDAKPAVTKMCNELAAEVAKGVPLSKALAEHPRAFDEVFVSYVRSGEEAGTLMESLGRLALLMAKRAAMQSKIKGVMAYPKMVGGTILLITFGIIMFLVPSYEKIYATFNAKLPAPTLALVWLSDHMLPFSITSFEMAGIKFPLPLPQPLNVLSFVLYIALAWYLFRRHTRGDLEVGRKLDILKFRMPVLGQLNHKSSLFRWSSTLSGSLSSGVPMTRALELAAEASGSDWQKLTAIEFTHAVRSGRAMSKAMEGHALLYPPNVRTMVATGEATGELDAMLESVAITLDEDVDSLISGLSAKIEVALLLLMGIVVGGLLLVLYMPILQLAMTATKGLGAG